MNKTYKGWLIIIVIAVVLLSAINTTVKANSVMKERYVCVAKLTKSKIYYYNLQFEGEVPRIKGKKKSMKTKHPSYYLYDGIPNPTVSPQKCSKSKMKKYIKSMRKLNGKGLYCKISIQNKKCVKISDVYWP